MGKEAALPYVVIEVGYEGIERIIWATEDPEEAAKVVRELREAIKELCTKSVKAVIKKFKDRDLFYVYKEVLEFAEFMDPDRICVQRFDIQRGGFRCFCDELGVGIDREILY